MAELSSSQPVRASAIAALQLAFDAQQPHRLYAEVMRTTGNAARRYAEALAPGVPEALKTFQNAAAGADPVARARAYDALMTDLQAVAYLAPPKDEYRSLLGCAWWRRGHLLAVLRHGLHVLVEGDHVHGHLTRGQLLALVEQAAGFSYASSRLGLLVTLRVFSGGREDGSGDLRVGLA